MTKGPARCPPVYRLPRRPRPALLAVRFEDHASPTVEMNVAAVRTDYRAGAELHRKPPTRGKRQTGVQAPWLEEVSPPRPPVPAE